MSDRLFVRFLSVSACFRGSDQLGIAAVPLLGAAVFGLPADQIGYMVAVQVSAWMLLSLPFGLAVDRTSPLKAYSRALALCGCGFALMLAGLGAEHVMLFSLGAFVVTAGAVLGFLAEGAGVQRMLPPEQLPAGNARIQILQSLAMLLGPLLMGFLVARGHGLAGLGIAFALTGVGLWFLRGIPADPRPERSRRAPLREIREGFLFVRDEPLLVGILACSLFWNVGFLALLAVFASYGLRVLGMSAAEVGLAQGAMGVASLLAAITAAPLLARFEPRFVLIFGPASSVVGVGLLWLAPAPLGPVVSVLTFFMLGYGPILWFICQNTIRQLIVPPEILSRVGSVILLAMYGVRSLGALLGGIVAEQFGFSVALFAITMCFVASSLAVSLSALSRLKKLPAPAGSLATSPR